MNKTDCFAYSDKFNNKCSVTTNTDCFKCAFYKTHEQQQKDLNKSAMRLEMLGGQYETTQI